MNHRIATDHLISEIIKSNADEDQRKGFAEYLIEKIVNEGYFKSSLIRQLIKIAADDKEEDSSNPFLKGQ